MNQELLFEKYVKLLKAVETTRNSQKKFFQLRTESNLKQAKQYEKELDYFVSSELMDIQSKQTKLF